MRKDYNLEDFLEDSRFARKVECSPAHNYLDQGFGSPSMALEKARLLREKGYSHLKAKGGSLPIERCTQPCISNALKNTYKQAKKNMAEHSERSRKRAEQFNKDWERARNSPQTTEQTLAAMDGGWYFVKQEHPEEFEQYMQELYG